MNCAQTNTFILALPLQIHVTEGQTKVFDRHFSFL